MYAYADAPGSSECAVTLVAVAFQPAAGVVPGSAGRGELRALGLVPPSVRDEPRASCSSRGWTIECTSGGLEVLFSTSTGRVSSSRAVDAVRTWDVRERTYSTQLKAADSRRPANG